MAWNTDSSKSDTSPSRTNTIPTTRMTTPMMATIASGDAARIELRRFPMIGSRTSSRPSFGRHRPLGHHWSHSRKSPAGQPPAGLGGDGHAREGYGRPLLASRCSAAASSACSSSEPVPQTESALGDNTITVSSFDFPESSLLAEIYSQAIERGGFDVDRTLRRRPRELVLPAMAAGFIEFVPEYLGTALQFLSLGAAEQTPGPARTFRDLYVDARHRTIRRAQLSARARLERVLRHA